MQELYNYVVNGGIEAVVIVVISGAFVLKLVIDIVRSE